MNKTYKPVQRLLIISCSATKLDTDQTLPAKQLYDGPAYRILRKNAETLSQGGNLCVLVVSAKYGIIGCDELISTYEQRMTAERGAEILADDHSQGLLQFCLSDRFELSAIHVHCSPDYRTALPMEQLLQRGATVATGGIGQQLGQLKRWLVQGA